MKNDELLSLTKKMITRPSPYYHEDELVDFCYNWLSDKEMTPNIIQYHETKVIGYSGKNVICVVDSGKPGYTFLLNGHLDTVPVCNNWDTNPFIPSELDGKIYGLGAVDMKSGSAVLMMITKYLNEHKDKWCGKVILTLVTDEEGPYGLGADALINKHLLPPVDCVISCEPSAGFSKKDFPVLSLGARGCFVYNIDFYGKSAHASEPELGINAMEQAAKFILETKKLELKEDPVLGKGSFNLLAMHSDGGACSVPDEARVTVHRHIVSFEDEEYVLSEARELISKAGVTTPYNINVRPEPSRGSRYYKPYYVDKDNKFVDLFIEAIKKQNNGKINIDYMKSIGDFNYFATRLFDENGNNPATFVFGPDGGNIHGANEYVVIETVKKTMDSVLEFMLNAMKEK